MKSLLKMAALCGLLWTNHALVAQRVTTDYILGTPETQVSQYSMPPGFYTIQMPFSFADSVFTSAKTNMFEDYPVYQVDLVYTDYRSSPTFSQEALNRRRLEALQKFQPQLFQQTAIEWKLVRQMDGATRQAASKLYHGFVFHFRVPKMLGRDGKMLELDAKAEMDLIHSALLDTLDPDYQPSIPCAIEPVNDTVINHHYEIETECKETGLFIPVRKKRQEKGMRFKRRSIFINRDSEQICEHDTTVIRDTLIGKTGITIPGHLDSSHFVTDVLTRFSYWHDSVVYNTFEAHPEWKNILVVEDVTGSMYPYAMQTLLWRRLSQEYNRIQHWAFFNDGDARPDGPIGRSDGVHFIRSDQANPVEEKVKFAMSKGYGGAGPENDIEAMEKGLKRSGFRPRAIVLIADNWSPVRDLRLFTRLRSPGIPIYVIVCGVWAGINVEYLEIARRTKGKVFTMEGELDGLLEANEGEKLLIRGQKYKVKSGKLVLTR